MWVVSFPLVVLYILLSYWIYKLVFKKSQNKSLSGVVLVMVLTFPFWDLIVQKGIKTFYQVSGLLEPKIYDYPEKDKKGMIDSVSLGDRTSQWYYEEIKNNTINKFIMSRYGNILKEKIKYLDFIFSVEGENKIFRFYFKDNQLQYQELKTEKARYKFVMHTPKDYRLGVYGIGTEKIIDNETEKVIAEAYGMGFDDIRLFEYIRKNILFLVGSNGAGMFYISSIGTRGEMWQKVIVKGE